MTQKITESGQEFSAHFYKSRIYSFPGRRHAIPFFENFDLCIPLKTNNFFLNVDVYTFPTLDPPLPSCPENFFYKIDSNLSFHQYGSTQKVDAIPTKGKLRVTPTVRVSS